MPNDTLSGSQLRAMKECKALLVRAKKVSNYLPAGVPPENATEVQVQTAEKASQLNLR